MLSAHDFYCVCPSLNLIDVRTGRPCCAAVDGPANPVACMRSLFSELGGPDPSDPPAFVERHRAEFRELMAAARMLIFPSQAARNLVARFHELHPARTRIVPHGAMPAPRRIRPARKPGPLRVALIGNIAYPAKGARNYVALLEQTRHLAITWHVFGDTSVFSFDADLRRIGLGSRLELHGRYRREDLPDLLVGADVDLAVLLPGCPETFSFTLSEALGAGVPVVVGAEGAMAERVRGKPIGMVVESVDAAAAAIAGLIANPTQLGKLRQATAEFRERSVDEMAAEYREIYEGLLADARAAGSLAVEERRELFAAHRDAPETAP